MRFIQFEVGAGGERLARAREHDDAHAVLGFHASASASVSSAMSASSNALWRSGRFERDEARRGPGVR